MSADEPDPLIGATIGPYRVDSLIGVGGMGRVYRGIDPDGQLVAIKLIRRDLAGDVIFRKRFDREARIAQRVVNRHVVPVLTTGEHEGIPYLAERFIPGGSLEDRLRREGRLPIEDSLRIAAQVAAGLTALVAEGLVHRDVKPANVLLDGDGRASITDFGLVKDSRGSVISRPGQALGSPHYMAPEQIRGEDVTSATDVYSLGCVVYACLSGAPPFANERGMKVMWAQLTEIPPDPCLGMPESPAALGPAVLSALAKEPTDRPAMALDYVDGLFRAAGLSPTELGRLL